MNNQETEMLVFKEILLLNTAKYLFSFFYKLSLINRK